MSETSAGPGGATAEFLDRTMSRLTFAGAVFLTVVAVLLAADLVSKVVAFSRVAGHPVSLVRDASGQLPPLGDP